MLKYWKMISVYSVAHFFVDFACAFLMFRFISASQSWYTSLLIYNFCAFAMQMPIGIIADKVNRNYLFAATGCIMIMTAFVFTGFPMLATVIVGLGNALFHIGGGIDVLNISSNQRIETNAAPRSVALGIFVSPGAFGVYFGTLLGRGDTDLFIPVIITLLIAATSIIMIRKKWSGSYIENEPFNPIPIKSNSKFPVMLLAIMCIFLVVCLRSYTGLSIDFPWKGIGYWGVALVCASAFGKAAGGFLADRYGFRQTSLITLSIAALLFFMPQLPLAGFGAIFLFNMTMPITLCLMAGIFPRAKGFSFGLLTFALFLGFLPVYLGITAPPVWVFSLVAIGTLGLLCIGLHYTLINSKRNNDE